MSLITESELSPRDLDDALLDDALLDGALLDAELAGLDELAELDDPERGVIHELDSRFARCADGNGTLTELFFSDHVLDIARAKAICAKCVHRERCLSDALERQEPWGVWGGELLSQGRIVAVKRPCGRPPKRPRPELVVDEMGVVIEAPASEVA